MLRSMMPLSAADKSPTTGTGARSRTHDGTDPRSVGNAAQSGGGADEGPPEGDWMAEHVMKPTNTGPVGLPPSRATATNAGQAVESRRGKQ